MSDRPAEQRGALTYGDAVERVPFLRSLSPAQRARLQPLAEIRTIPSDRAAFRVGETSREFLFVVEGHFKLVRSHKNGRQVILDLRGPGDLLCAGAVTAFVPYCCSAVPLQDSATVVAFARRELTRLLEDHAPINAVFVGQAACHEMRMAERVFEMTHGQVEQRIAAVLLRLAEQAGIGGPDGSVKIPIRLSRQDLADVCGTTLESAIRTMTHLSREQIVKTLPRGFAVLNRNGLACVAQWAWRRHVSAERD